MIDLFSIVERSSLEVSTITRKCSSFENIRITPSGRVISWSTQRNRVRIDVIDIAGKCSVVVNVPGAENVWIAGWWEFDGDPPSLEHKEEIATVEHITSPVNDELSYWVATNQRGSPVLKILITFLTSDGYVFSDLQWSNRQMKQVGCYYCPKQRSITSYALTSSGYWRLKWSSGQLEVVSPVGSVMVDDPSIDDNGVATYMQDSIVCQFMEFKNELYVGIFVVDGKLVVGKYRSGWSFHHISNRQYLVYIIDTTTVVVDMLTGKEVMKVEIGRGSFPLAYDDQYHLLIYKSNSGVVGYRCGEHVVYLTIEPDQFLLSYHWVQETHTLYVLYQGSKQTLAIIAISEVD